MIKQIHMDCFHNSHMEAKAQNLLTKRLVKDQPLFDHRVSSFGLEEVQSLTSAPTLQPHSDSRGMAVQLF